MQQNVNFSARLKSNQIYFNAAQKSIYTEELIHPIKEQKADEIPGRTHVAKTQSAGSLRVDASDLTCPAI